MTIINVNNVCRSFGKTPVLKDISLQVQQSTIYGLVGLNGAGKTTLIRVLLGILRRDGGSAEVAGFDPWLHEREYYRNIGVSLEGDGFFGNLSVKENLKIYAEAKGLAWGDVEKYLDEHWGATDILRHNKKVKYLSRGQRVECGLCRAFMGWPKAYFLDEPTVSLDVRAYEHMKRVAKEAKSRGAAVLVSSHQLELIDDLCDRVGLLRDGSVTEIDRGERGGFSGVIKDAYKY